MQLELNLISNVDYAHNYRNLNQQKRQICEEAFVKGQCFPLVAEHTFHWTKRFTYIEWNDEQNCFATLVLYSTSMLLTKGE